MWTVFGSDSHSRLLKSNRGHPSSYKADWISKCQSFWRVMLGTLPVLVAVGWVSFLLYFYVTAAIYKKVRVFLILCCIGTVILQWSEGSRWMYKFPVIFVCKVWVLSYLLCPPPLPSLASFTLNTSNFLDYYDWLIDWIEFYAVSAIFKSCNGGLGLLTLNDIWTAINV